MLLGFKKGQIPWNKGKTMTEEFRQKVSISLQHHRKKLSEGKKGKKNPMYGKSGELHHNYGKHWSEESRRKNSESNKKWYADGGKTWNKGKTGIFTEEALEKIREARSKQKFPSQDSKPEKFLQKLCNNARIKFQKHKNFKLGFQRHDVDLFVEPNICIEVDGDYWHGNPNDYVYRGKIEPGLKPDEIIVQSKYTQKTANWVRKNDKKITRALVQQGNVVLRFWQSELEQNPEKCIKKILRTIKKSKR